MENSSRTGASPSTPNFQTQEIADMFAEIYYGDLSYVNDLRSVLGGFYPGGMNGNITAV
jgi:hypothetical protein